MHKHRAFGFSEYGKLGLAPQSQVGSGDAQNKNSRVMVLEFSAHAVVMDALENDLYMFTFEHPVVRIQTCVTAHHDRLHVGRRLHPFRQVKVARVGHQKGRQHAGQNGSCAGQPQQESLPELRLLIGVLQSALARRRLCRTACARVVPVNRWTHGLAAM